MNDTERDKIKECVLGFFPRKYRPELLVLDDADVIKITDPETGHFVKCSFKKGEIVRLIDYLRPYDHFTPLIDQIPDIAFGQALKDRMVSALCDQ